MHIPDESWSWVSYFMGTSSLLIWLCAQMPQILKNWRRKSVDGISPGFLVAWIAGDASNLLGCILTNQLGVQVLLASYYCLVDFVLVGQFWLYHEPHAGVIAGVEPLGSPTDANDNTNHLRKSSAVSIRARLSSLASISTFAGSVGRASAAPVVGPQARGLLGVMNSEPASVDIGFLVAYFSTAMYLTSRIPQIWHNFQRKSTTGISMLLFISALLGNLTYTLSIVLSPEAVLGDPIERRAFILKELPYILGATGTMLFDCIILFQWYYYRWIRHNSRRRSTLDYDRISRPYLGSPQLQPARVSLDLRQPRPSQRTVSFSVPHDPLGFKHKRRSSRRDRTSLLSSSYSNYGAGENGADDVPNDESAIF